MLTDERIYEIWTSQSTYADITKSQLRYLARAIEAEVRADAQEPVAWFAFADSNGLVPLELWGFDEKACKNAVLENARSVGWKGTVEGYLFQKSWTIRPLVFAAPQPPAPCPNCIGSEATLQAIAEHVDWAFIGDLDDVVAARINERNDAIAHFAAECSALQAKVAEQSAEIERLTALLKQYNEVRSYLKHSEGDSSADLRDSYQQVDDFHAGNYKGV